VAGNKKNPSTGRTPTKTILTRHLKELAEQLSDRLGDDGNALTRAAALARVIWDRAIGYTEHGDGGADVEHKPEPWAVGLIYERLEGRCPTAEDVGAHKGTVSDRISDLSKSKVNALTEAPPEDAPE
jgi:hypothetical protein